MNYFDPSRPRICGRPAYVAEGKAIAPLPPLVITPFKDEDDPYRITYRYRVEFMLVHDDKGGIWYERICALGDLGALLSRWDSDPEAVLADLGWTYRLLRDPAPEWSEEDDDALVGLTTLSLDDIE